MYQCRGIESGPSEGAHHHKLPGVTVPHAETKHKGQVSSPSSISSSVHAELHLLRIQELTSFSTVSNHLNDKTPEDVVLWHTIQLDTSILQEVDRMRPCHDHHHVYYGRHQPYEVCRAEEFVSR